MHGMAPALNYGQQAYEGLKAFRTPGDKSIQIFRPDRNAARMQHSAAFVSMPPVPIDTFIDACRAAVALNAEWVPPHDTGAAMYVRPQMYGSSAQLGLTPPEEYMFSVYVLPTGVYHGVHPVKCLILEEFDRAAPNGTGSAKVGGNYAPVLRWTDKARAEGFDITLHLDSATHTEIDEFSTSGFIGAAVEGDSVTIVVPDSNSVIKSVTSESIQGIAKSFGWKVEQRSVSQSFEQSGQLLRFSFSLFADQDAVHGSDQILGTCQLPGSHGGRHGGVPRAHPVHHPSRRRLGPKVPCRGRQVTPKAISRHGQGRGDGHVCPRRAGGRGRAVPEAAGSAQGDPDG